MGLVFLPLLAEQWQNEPDAVASLFGVEWERSRPGTPRARPRCSLGRLQPLSRVLVLTGGGRRHCGSFWQPPAAPEPDQTTRGELLKTTPLNAAPESFSRAALTSSYYEAPCLLLPSMQTIQQSCRAAAARPSGVHLYVYRAKAQPEASQSALKTN